MPAKQTKLSEAERRKRILAAAKEAEVENDPKALDRAFKRVVGKKSATATRPK